MLVLIIDLTLRLVVCELDDVAASHGMRGEPCIALLCARDLTSAR
jgi:hypothetical protein